MSYPIDGSTFGGSRQPGPWILGNAIALPTLQRVDQRILEGILCKIEILELADQCCQDATVLFAESSSNQT